MLRDTQTQLKERATRRMTVLDEYQRLEAPAVWRTSPEDRLEVLVSVGNASLITYTFKDEPLAHWSLGAMERANPDQMPAVYHPAGESERDIGVRRIGDGDGSGH